MSWQNRRTLPGLLESNSMAETLSGTIERVVFHNADSGFAVLRGIVRGRGEVTVVGQVPKVQAGEYFEATGAWKNDLDHGVQFKAEQLRTMPPQTAAGIEKYLSSGFVKGIGPGLAKRIVAAFGERTLAVIDESPTHLQEIRGIGKQRILRIRESWLQQKAVRSIMVFLQSYGVGMNRATRIYKTYGNQAIELVRVNPYRLANDIWGVGFQTADELAGKLGIDPSSPLRARAALRYVLKSASEEGHVGFPEEGVIERTRELTQIDPKIITDAIKEQREAGELVSDQVGGQSWLYLKGLHISEKDSAGLLRALTRGFHPLAGIDIEAALIWVQKRIGLELAETQKAAVRQAVSQKALVITGGPGVGKTTIVRAILEIFQAKKLRCGLAAPTGRAAKRLAETTGREGKTLHRLLEFEASNGEFNRNRDRPLDFDLLVVDEASMIDIVIFCHLLRALPSRTCLVLVGDIDQLPSVGPGNVLADVIGSRVVAVARLTEIFRQAERSWIVRAAHRVNHGQEPESAPAGQGDFFFVEAETPEAILDCVVTLVRERIPARFGFDRLRDIQVLTPMNRTELGARNLNEQLQKVLNPAAATGGVPRLGRRYHVGDKVLQTVNDYPKEVFNGDIGRIREIDEGDEEITVDFEGRPVLYDFDELDELALAYALTIHKAQGSEYPAVVIPLHTQHYVMLQRNLLYTGITRGKKLVVLVGSRKALSIAVQRHESRRRYSALGWRLQS
jgi:exodeoxyribonuclease V alpha subunit